MGLPTSPRRVARAAALACAASALALTPVAGAKGDPKLTVSKLAAPPETAYSGESFRVAGKIANAGRRDARARIAVVLLGRSGSRGIDLGGRRLKVPGDDSKRFKALVTVPENVEGGRYGLMVCVRRAGGRGRSDCETTRQRLTVAPTPHAPPALPAPGPDEPGPAEPGPTDPGPPPVPRCTDAPAGPRSAGDDLFPEIGNGGYDASHYDVTLDYNPVANLFNSATTRITAKATRDLPEFSLDLQGLDVSSVTVDGAPAEFGFEGPKLVVDPASAIPAGAQFVAAVDYSGTPQEITDPDESKEGWIHDSGPTPDGGFVVNEPIGAQGWFPSNNHPSDKASFDFHIKVPAGFTALGNGELVSDPDNGADPWTWHWREDDPTATYLTTATVGNFVYTEESISETLSRRTLPEYRAVDASYTPGALATTYVELDRIEGMTNFLGVLYGPYPFDSTGAVVDSAPAIGYALEVQTKSHFSLPLSPVFTSTLLHEIAHQWMGDSVSPAMWSDIWFNEGWARWSEWFWGNQANGSATTPEQQFENNYGSGPETKWEVAPAVLDCDPANLFATFPVYTRGAMTLQGYREIVGHETFVELAKRLTTERAYGNISTAGFIAMAKEVSDFTGERLQRLDEYFQQWLYGETKPAITPDNF